MEKKNYYNSKINKKMMEKNYYSYYSFPHCFIINCYSKCIVFFNYSRGMKKYRLVFDYFTF